MCLFVAAVVGAGVGAVVGGRRKVSRGGPGAGATGAIHDLLNEDKRRAIEIVVEERAVNPWRRCSATRANGLPMT
jgi:hypothetical protein